MNARQYTILDQETTASMASDGATILTVAAINPRGQRTRTTVRLPPGSLPLVCSVLHKLLQSSTPPSG